MTFSGFVFTLIGVAVWTHVVAGLRAPEREQIKAQSRAVFVAILLGILVSAALKELGIAGGEQFEWARDWHTEIGVLVAVVEFMRRNWKMALPPQS
jgi:L-cystine uptake protein TcyP (sodium:dicarboxylate symporter family)